MARKNLIPRRLGLLMRGPGMDTRYHIKRAIVDQVVVDPAEGVFADITLMPNNEPETAFVGVPYAGGGFGFYVPIQVDDTVLVAIPDGDTSTGPVIIARCWDAGDPPFADMLGTPLEGSPGQYNPAEKVLLRAKPETPININTSGTAGAIAITVEGDGTLVVRAQGSGKITIEQSGSGNIEIKQTGSGEVIIQGPSPAVLHRAARVTDPTRIGKLTGTAGPWPVQFTFIPEDADGVPQAPVGPTPTVELSGVVSNAGGATHVKVG